MKYTFLLFLLPLTLAGQKSKTNLVTTTDINKWERAIINLEMRKELWENLDSINLDWKKHDPSKIEARITGTALFLKYKGDRYLLTAQHILFDKILVAQKIKYNILDTINDPYKVYNKILRIKVEKEINDSYIYDMPLSILSALPYANCNYIFSEPTQDLAIISFDGKHNSNKIFADLLEKEHYVPISISDIDTTQANYGDDVMTIGFPSFGFLGRYFLPKNDEIWHSNLAFNPIASFGRIASPNFNKYYFVSDMSVAPGNSGGPIIKKNKLIGIVSSQPYFNIEDSNGTAIPNAVFRLPYAFGVKASLILPLLRQMAEKQKNNELYWEAKMKK